MFNSNTEAGIIDATLDDAKKKLDKIKFAYKKLPEEIKQERKIVVSNTQEVSFNNGSRITADTSYRGSTVQILHISEYAKICKKDPIKANEIKNGALNAIAPGQIVFMESTAEDGEGYFFEYCQKAEKQQLTNETLTKLDFKFFFFPWYEDNGYRIEVPNGFIFSEESSKYFKNLTIDTDNEQRLFYIKKKELLGEDIKKEFPSNASEAFEASTEDKYYKPLIIELIKNKQICEFEIDPGIEVDMDWDLGIDDYMSILFSQRIGKEIHIVDYLEASGEIISFYANEIKRRNYLLGKCYLPHDGNNRNLVSTKTPASELLEYGFKVDTVPALDIEYGINEVRKLMPRMWFKKSTTGPFVNHIEHYSKKWNEQLGRYVGPNHNIHSHAADTLRGLAVRYRESIIPSKKLNKRKPTDIYNY